jgi:hypothetical protein
MKSLHIIFSSLFSIAMLPGCQSDEVAPQKMNDSFPTESEYAPVKLHRNSIPPDEVVRTDYPKTRKWRFTFEDHGFSWWWMTQRFFSVKTGSFYSYYDLNTIPKAVSKADIYFDFGHIKAPIYTVEYLDHGEQARSTQFKKANMSAWELASMTAFNYQQFQAKFERSPIEPSFQVPVGSHMKSGDIFLFKTDNPVPDYGVIHIIEKLGISSTGDDPFRIEAEIIVHVNNNQEDL